MPRKPDPTLKPAIIAKVAEHLRHTKLEDVSVRSLGRVLGTSAYPIVYHFGSRGALIDAVVEHLSSTACTAALDPDSDAEALADYLVDVFGGLDDPDRSLAARLTFELGSVESLSGHDDHVRERERSFQRDQVAVLGAWCSAHGYGRAEADRAAREAVLAARGLQWGAVVDCTRDDTDTALRSIARSLAWGAPVAAA